MFFYLGTELGIKVNSKSFVTYRENGIKEHEVIGKNLNLNSLTCNVRAGFGVRNTSLFVSYGLVSLFKKDKGANVVPVSLGVTFGF